MRAASRLTPESPLFLDSPLRPAFPNKRRNPLSVSASVSLAVSPSPLPLPALLFSPLPISLLFVFSLLPSLSSPLLTPVPTHPIPSVSPVRPSEPPIPHPPLRTARSILRPPHPLPLSNRGCRVRSIPSGEYFSLSHPLFAVLWSVGACLL